jgi:hypothetical protein
MALWWYRRRRDSGTKIAPRPTTSGADASLAELLLPPVLMAGLSLLMWFSLPTFPEAFDGVGDRIDERRELISRLATEAAALLPAQSSSCLAPVDPLPVFAISGPAEDALPEVES